jgi:hypothetical protein
MNGLVDDVESLKDVDNGSYRCCGLQCCYRDGTSRGSYSPHQRMTWLVEVPKGLSPQEALGSSSTTRSIRLFYLELAEKLKRVWRKAETATSVWASGNHTHESRQGSWLASWRERKGGGGRL